MFIYIVAAQQGPGTVIAHPGQTVELLCNITPSESELIGWIINQEAHALNSIQNGIEPGYTANLGSNNLIVQNIMMNDDRNDTEYQCAIVIVGEKEGDTPAKTEVIRRSEPTILYVAGEY